MSIIKSLFIGLFLGIVFLIIIAISISLIYEKEVSQYLVEELNQHISVKINVEQVSFSLLRKFPDASIELKNITAYSPSDFSNKILGFKTDTLFYANSIFLQFNILDILSKKYNINNIHFDKGKIHLFVDNYGIENYVFWNSESQSSDDSFNLNLEKVKITQAEVVYYNESNNTQFKADFGIANLSGLFFNKNYSLSINSAFDINYLTIDKYIYISEKAVILKSLLNIDDNNITFKLSDITVESFDASLTGSIQKQDDPILDLLITANNQEFSSLLNVLPEKIKEEFSNIESRKGEITLSTKITGPVTKYSNPNIHGEFQLKNASVLSLGNSLKINNIYIQGNYSNGNKNSAETSFLDITSFNGSLENSVASGSFKMRNFSDPSIFFKIDTEIDLTELKHNLNIDTLEILEGNGKLQGQISGKYNEIKNYRFSDFFKKNITFNLRLIHGRLKVKGHPLIIEKINGTISANENLYTDSLCFNILDNDFLIRGEALNLYNYFSLTAPAYIKAQLISNTINLNQLSPMFFVEKFETNNPSYKFPEMLNLQLELQIQSFEIGKFRASNIKGNLNYKPKMFSLHEITFNSMDGELKIGGVVIQDYKNRFLVKSQSSLANIDINKLFNCFNDFGQTFIVEKNITGKITGNIFFTSEFSDKLEINKRSVITESDIILSNGALVNFEPMKSLSKYIDVKELEYIKFSTLHNQITIKDEQVIIPKMDIASSAINITASGIHKFDNSFDYHIRVLLSDILSRKAKSDAQKTGDFDNVEDDGLGKTNIYLKIQGNPDDYKISYDRKQAREARKEELKNERQQLRKILNQEFGWYKNDSLLNLDTLKPNNKNSFKIEWEENPSKKNSKNKDPETITSPKFEITFDEDSISNQI